MMAAKGKNTPPAKKSGGLFSFGKKPEPEPVKKSGFSFNFGGKKDDAGVGKKVANASKTNKAKTTGGAFNKGRNTAGKKPETPKKGGFSFFGKK